MLAVVNSPNAAAPVELREVPEPQPAPNEALVEVRAFSLNRGELRLFQVRPEGWRPGQDISGVVVQSAADGGGPKAEGQAERIVRGELILDPSRHQCTWKGKEVHLTVTEFLLLKSLAERPGHVKNRDQLMDAAYGETIYVDDRTIDSHIKRVRRKFREVDGEFEQIETLYGIGYRYRDA